MNFHNTPRLPRALLHPLVVFERTFQRIHGGQSVPVDKAVAVIMGVIMPLSNKDWKLLPEGSFTQNSQKLYTDDETNLKPGYTVQDTLDGQVYTVKTELNHNTIHPMMRYIVEGVTKK